MIKEELETVAFLARINIEETEKEKYLIDMNKMLNYIKILQEPDVTDLKPTVYVTKLKNVWREDFVRPCSREVINQMLNSAPKREKTFYRIKKVIE